MAPNVPTRPALRSRYEGRRADVIQEAARLFAERGYDGTGLDDLSDATGLAIGGLYHYIGGKQDLLSAIFEQLMDPILERALEIEQEDAPAVERLRRLITAWIRHVAEHRHHMLVFSQERHALEHDPERWREIRASRRHFERILSELINEAGAEADVKSGADLPGRAPDLEVIHFALLGMINYTPQWLKPSGRLDPDRIADGYSAIISAALSPGCSLSPKSQLNRNQ